MIERIEWNHSASAFMRGAGEGPITVTLHSSSFTELPDEETSAVALLREFSHLPLIQTFETEHGSSPYIKIKDSELEAEHIPVEIVSQGEIIADTLIWFPKQWPGIAAGLVGQIDLNHKEAEEMLDLLLTVQAHRSAGGDIFVTSSPLLLKHRGKTFLREGNIRTPTEAAKIIGLFLRSRNTYPITVRPKVTTTFSRGLFYWILMRGQLPKIWKYSNAFSKTEITKGKILQRLGESILIRCQRALEARDAIGIQFYELQDSNARDVIMYHFDYLTLLLAGAFDAQAEIIKIVYQITSDARGFLFGNNAFLNKLKVKHQDLYEFLTEEKFKSLKALLCTLRHTIHAANLKTFSLNVEGRERPLQVDIPPDSVRNIVDASRLINSTDAWGITSGPWGTSFEPYNYACSLINLGFECLNGIANRTDVKLLFDEVPLLNDSPPTDSPFDKTDRVMLLG